MYLHEKCYNNLFLCYLTSFLVFLYYILPKIPQNLYYFLTMEQRDEWHFSTLINIISPSIIYDGLGILVNYQREYIVVPLTSSYQAPKLQGSGARPREGKPSRLHVPWEKLAHSLPFIGHGKFFIALPSLRWQVLSWERYNKTNAKWWAFSLTKTVNTRKYENLGVRRSLLWVIGLWNALIDFFIIWEEISNQECQMYMSNLTVQQ